MLGMPQILKAKHLNRFNVLWPQLFKRWVAQFTVDKRVPNQNT